MGNSRKFAQNLNYWDILQRETANSLYLILMFLISHSWSFESTVVKNHRALLIFDSRAQTAVSSKYIAVLFQVFYFGVLMVGKVGLYQHH